MPLSKQEMDWIADGIQEKHIGPETEGIAVNPKTLEGIHMIGDLQPTQAVKQWIDHQLGEEGIAISKFITPDVTEMTVEANPDPLVTPRASAAVQRLYSILLDAACQGLSEEHGIGIQLQKGVALRSLNITSEDVSKQAKSFSRAYYEYQVKNYGDKMAAAAGDHLNFSAPWRRMSPHEMTNLMVQITGRMRLLVVPLLIALSAASPLSFGQFNGSGERMIMTPYDSTRLGKVWPGRTNMDLSTLFRNGEMFRSELENLQRDNYLLTGRDLYLPVRPQPGSIQGLPDFPETDLCFSESRDRIFALFDFGRAHSSFGEVNPYLSDDHFQKVQSWREEYLSKFINAPRERLEVRVFETAPAFEGQTPYQHTKGLHTFAELMFIYLSQSPECVQQLTHSEVELQAAKSNEKAVLQGGLNARLHWIPGGMKKASARSMLKFFLDRIQPLAKEFNREEDLEYIREIADGLRKTPAEMIRHEVENRYNISTERDREHMLPDDQYPKDLLIRTRKAMQLEVEQIENDLSSLPESDQETVRTLLEVTKKLWFRMTPSSIS
ncbi:MAG: hypothetical protein P1V18_05995 [Candidatus Gracilibacteria bacterium]|nr:hypothetical protein [Candidatus Gracilibacteria bacterium]